MAFFRRIAKTEKNRPIRLLLFSLKNMTIVLLQKTLFWVSLTRTRQMIIEIVLTFELPSALIASEWWIVLRKKIEIRNFETFDESPDSKFLPSGCQKAVEEHLVFQLVGH